MSVTFEMVEKVIALENLGVTDNLGVFLYTYQLPAF